MPNHIKEFEWMIDGASHMKMESEDAPKRDTVREEVTEEKVFELEKGSLKVCFADEGDMEFDDSSNTIILYDNTSYWVSYNEKSQDMDVDALGSLLTMRIKNRGILNSEYYVDILDIGQLGSQIIVRSRKVNYDDDFSNLR